MSTLCLGAIIIADGADALLLAEVEVVKAVELMSVGILRHGLAAMVMTPS
jgi:hypothetical protein